MKLRKPWMLTTWVGNTPKREWKDIRRAAHPRLRRAYGGLVLRLTPDHDFILRWPVAR